jgi:hypothetical protein
VSAVQPVINWISWEGHIDVISVDLFKPKAQVNAEMRKQGLERGKGTVGNRSQGSKGLGIVEFDKDD